MMQQISSLHRQKAQQADHPKVQQKLGQNPDSHVDTTLYYSKMHVYVRKEVSYHRSFIANALAHLETLQETDKQL